MRGMIPAYYQRMKTSRYWPLLRWPYYAGLLFITFVFLSMLANAVVLPLITRHGSEFPTPLVRGKSLREAEGILKAQGLRIEIESRQHSPKIPENVIIDQVPKSGSMVKKGRRVKVIVSAGARMTVVPFLRGYTLRQAELMLEETGLMIGGESFCRDDSLPGGVVVSSIPTGGGSVPVGTVVNILINETDEFALVTVPILVGENIKKAEALLDGRGLRLGAVYREIDEVLLPGTVVRQSIGAGEQVRRGSTVDVTITKENW
ncbi:PASTA domain-containing protein [Candidatus Zixiibacteriota bacterium]